jgi:hypothetical protein
MIVAIYSHITKFMLIFTFIHIYKNEHFVLLKPYNINLFILKLQYDLILLYNQLLNLICTMNRLSFFCNLKVTNHKCTITSTRFEFSLEIFQGYITIHFWESLNPLMHRTTNFQKLHFKYLFNK